MKKLAMVLGFTALVAGSASAQTTQAASTSIVIGTVLSLGVTNTTVAFASPTATDFTAGKLASTTTSAVTASGNVEFSVVLWTAAATMTGSAGTSLTDPVNASKAVSDFQWSINGGTSYTGAVASSTSSTGGKVISKHARGANVAQNVNYQMLLSYATDTPGQYDLAFNYTIIAD